MGYMSAIAADGGDLGVAVSAAWAATSDPYDGQIAEAAHNAGWISPTEAQLVCRLLQGQPDAGALARARAILSPGTSRC
jgi:hypothetical protein